MPYYPPKPDPKSDPRPDPPSGNNPSRKASLLRLALLCVSVLLIAYGSFRLIRYGSDWISSQRTTRDLREAADAAEAAAEADAAAEAEAADVPEGSSAPASAQPRQESPTRRPTEASSSVQTSPSLSDTLPEVPYPGGFELNERIRALRKKSKYIIGWITMDELDEPVVCRDNTFFLDHDVMGKQNVNGAIFMDETTRLLTRPYTILLFGHNMKSGAMFGRLHKYRTFSYCYRHRIFRFDTLYEEGTYTAFSVGIVSLIPGTSRYLDISALESSDRETRRSAVKTLQRLSEVNMPTDVNEEDQILVLVTCEGSDDERLILAARRQREGERF